MNWKTGLRKGRSHIIFAMALIVAGIILVRLDDQELRQHIDRRCVQADVTRPCPGQQPQQP